MKRPNEPRSQRLVWTTRARALLVRLPHAWPITAMVFRKPLQALDSEEWDILDPPPGP